MVLDILLWNLLGMLWLITGIYTACLERLSHTRPLPWLVICGYLTFGPVILVRDTYYTVKLLRTITHEEKIH